MYKESPLWTEFLNFIEKLTINKIFLNINSQDIFIDSNTKVFRETKYGICFYLKQKNLTLKPLKKSDMYTKRDPLWSEFLIFIEK